MGFAIIAHGANPMCSAAKETGVQSCETTSQTSRPGINEEIVVRALHKGLEFLCSTAD